MKKAFIIFAALFVAYASIGYFFAIDKSFRNELMAKFGNSVYITAKPANIEQSKELLQKTRHVQNRLEHIDIFQLQGGFAGEKYTV